MGGSQATRDEHSPIIHGPHPAAIQVLPDANLLAQVNAIKDALATDGQGRARAAAEAQPAPVYGGDKSLWREKGRGVVLPQRAAHAHLEARAKNLAHVHDCVVPKYLVVVVTRQPASMKGQYEGSALVTPTPSPILCHSLRKWHATVDASSVWARLQIGKLPLASKALCRPGCSEVGELLHQSIYLRAFILLPF